MDSSSYPYLIFFFILLSAFFSGSETALFSLTKIQQKKLENSTNNADKRIVQLLSKPRFLLITILLGNTLVNMAISSFSTLYVIKLKEFYNVQISVSVLISLQITFSTLFILIFGEIVPKLIAWVQAYRVAKIVSFPLIILGYLLYPVLKILEQFSLMISRKNIQPHQNHITSEEFHTLIHSENSLHELEEHEKRILTGLFKLPKAEVREIIVPRVEITAIEEHKNIDELKKLIISSGYSRIPIYRNTIDDIIGVVYAKDILLYPTRKTIAELMHPVYFVPENMKIQTLLNQFKSCKSQLAVVVDEYGGTKGIITLEDIMEELVGEIQDEYDKDEIPDFIKIDDYTYELSGSCAIRDLNNELGIDIDPEKFDNIADFLLEYFNHVPKIKEKMNYKNTVDFIIKDSNKRRINRILAIVHRIDEQMI